MSEERTAADPYLWLEETEGERALAWVAAQNAKTRAAFCDADFEASAEAMRAALDSDDKIPFATKRGEHYYNFWRDAQHPKGLWRRTTWDSYRSARPEWDVLLDVDALAAEDGVEWVFHGAQLRRPGFDRALISLSPDGGDAVTVREFDVADRAFVPGGFDIPAAKTSASWVDADALLLATDFGPGTMTASSYPASVRLLRRGQELGEAVEIAAVPHDHLTAFGAVDHTPGFERAIVGDVIDFHHQRLRFAPLPAEAPAAPDGAGQDRAAALEGAAWTDIDIPTDISVDIDRELLLFRPRTDWAGEGFSVPAGALAVAPLEEFAAGRAVPRVVFAPDPATSLQGWTLTRNFLVLSLLRDVQCVNRVLDLRADFAARELPAATKNQTVSLGAVDPDDPATADDYWLIETGFTEPTALRRGSLGSQEPPEAVKALPALFDARGLEVAQHFATSADGTRVPYFQISEAGMPLDGANPVRLDGYGGSEVSRLPGYAPVIGIGWLDRRTASSAGGGAGPDGAAEEGAAGVPRTVAPGRRGVFAVANIRGGGEYGPQWHAAALRENRQRAYEDFAAVAADLVERGVTNPRALACSGGSNGGLLVGNMLTQFPELFGAVSCGVPLLDMDRYVHLSAGTSWIAEYGDPNDPEQWAFIRTFSPYHLFDDRRRGDYPPVLFWTATSDDRVGPVQARKMAAKMQDAGIPDVWFYEDTEGGHSAASDNRQAARTHALSVRFLWKALTGE